MSGLLQKRTGMSTEEMITIPFSEYEALKQDAEILAKLYAATLKSVQGTIRTDNREWYRGAMDA